LRAAQFRFIHFFRWAEPTLPDWFEADDCAGSRKTLTPFVRIARGVKYAVDDYPAFYILVEDCIRKAAHQPSPIVLVEDIMRLGRAADRFKARLYAAKKLFYQAGPPTLVPGIAFCDVLLGLRRNAQLSGHSDFGPFV